MMTSSSITNLELARPHDGAVAGVERIQDSGCTKCIDATIAERWRPARTGAGVRFPEPGRVAMSPHRLAGRHLVAGDDLVLTALLLGVEKVSAHRERRPARSDRPAPQLDRWRRSPVRPDSHAANDAVALGSAKTGPVRIFVRCCRSRRKCRWFVAGLGQEPFLGSLGPSPVQIR